MRIVHEFKPIFYLVNASVKSCNDLALKRDEFYNILTDYLASSSIHLNIKKSVSIVFCNNTRTQLFLSLKTKSKIFLDSEVLFLSKSI